MTIGVIASRARSQVVWVGHAPSPDTRLLLERLRFLVDDSQSRQDLFQDAALAGVAAVVFVQSDTKPLSIVAELSAHAGRLLDHGCLVFVLATKAGHASVVNELTGLKIPSAWQTTTPSGPQTIEANSFIHFDGQAKLPGSGDPLPLPHVRVLQNSALAEQEIANLIVRFGPKNPLASSLTIELRARERNAEPLSPAHQLALRRSFFDCSEIHLNEITEGRSGTRVFLAHAKLSQSLIRPRLEPFFVKLGPRRKIIREWQNYDGRVRHHVPFYLAPSLDMERCAVGAREGIIVGNFVEDSESLGSCTRDGRSHSSIGALFDRTLRGWHLQTDKVDHRPDVAFGWMVARTIPAARLRQAKKMGARRDPKALAIELAALPIESFRYGEIHGDLHAHNVQVRGPDAILIDFCKSKTGLLLADPAALEVSLAVRAPQERGFNPDAWLRIVGDLYQKESLEKAPRTHNPTEQYSWLASAVRQVRLHALAMELRAGQYATVLAYYLFYAATMDANAEPAEAYRRAGAYYLADRLLDIAWP